ncbi:PGG domain [Sesbania bispinosa]|nr:PGG domain [Sesbania bispinosa]
MASNVNTMNDKLKIAAENNDINLLYRVIQEEPQVGDLFDMVETPLHIAASAGHLQFATEIMTLKPSYAWKLNQQGFSPIHVAMQHGQKRMVFGFVKFNKDLVRIKGREGLTPLHFASQTGEVDLLANFLSACPDSIEDVTVKDETALHIAVKNKRYEALNVMVGWLKRTRQRGAMELQNIILNSKDEEGNTILHISARSNDSQVLRLLVKTGMDLNAKNLENSTALDIAAKNLENSIARDIALDIVASAEAESILLKARAKRGSSVTDAPTLADEIRKKVTIMDNILIFILRIRSDITEDQRNAFLIIAALVATVTFQSALSPPGGVFQADAGANNSTEEKVGRSVISEDKFIFFSIFNGVSLLVSFMIIYILTPSGIVGRILFTPVFLFIYCYIFSMALISPTLGTAVFNNSMLVLFSFLYGWLSWTLAMAYDRLQNQVKNKEWHRGNRWI